jgi:hypothetical protein
MSELAYQFISQSDDSDVVTYVVVAVLADIIQILKRVRRANTKRLETCYIVFSTSTDTLY